MKNNKIVGLFEYKAYASLHGNSQDLFYETENEIFGCNEESFYEWLLEQRMFQSEYKNNKVHSLSDVMMPNRMWGFFVKHFTRFKRTKYLVEQFPSGYFEAVCSVDENKVAALLPDTYGKKPYRISFYTDRGPTYHETFSTRIEALIHLANQGYVAKEGALDSLVGTEAWDRGLQITRWLSEGLHPMDGLKRDKKSKEIAKLFSQEILEYYPEIL